MKQIMGWGVTHAPNMTRDPAAGDPKQVEGLLRTFANAKESIDRFHPDVVIMISADHVNKFFLDNVPAFCVGVAPKFDGPSDLGAGLPYTEMPGHEAFGEELVRGALQDGFDVSYTRNWKLDHGMMVPIHLLTQYQYPIVPIFVNAALPPLPTSKRCIQLGKFIHRFIEKQTLAQRVVVVGAGGLSHSVGREDMGKIDAEFDRKFMRFIEEGDESSLASISYEEMDRVGGSTAEVLAWMIAAGVFLPAKGKSEFYEPIQGFATGCGVSSWSLVEV